jgi:lipoprotein-releasing system permease protein
MRTPLALFVASRYFRTRRRDRGYGSSLVSVLGIGVGVMTLTVVLAVMNGFQLGFIESIVELSSYHLQVTPRPGSAGQDAAQPTEAGLRSVAQVRAAVPFVERQALLQTPYARPRACSVRAVPADLLARDPSQAGRLEMRDGSFDLGLSGSILVGSELAAATGARVGEPLDLVTLERGSGGIAARRTPLVVAGIFRTGYYDFDAGLAYVALDAADGLFGGGSPVPRTWGIKIADRFADQAALREVSRLPGAGSWEVQSWRRYNRSFFDALFMEKLMMMLLVGLIFVVVGFNVYHSLRRAVLEKVEEIALLKALGVPPLQVQAVFMLEGLLIGLAGAGAGMTLGLLVSVNINAVFDLVERVVNGILAAVTALAAPLLPVPAGGGFSIFSPMYFYLTSVPSRVLPREAFLVVFLALLACVAAAGAASRAVSRNRPAEVLRNE